MLQVLITLGQTASVLLLLYGVVLVLLPAKRPQVDLAAEEKAFLLRHLRTDA